jgi:membrane fusion protein (multidrug efflux system)
MIERRSTITALVAACMVTAFAAGSFAQQAAPPAVLVQAATLTPVADQAEFIGRAAAVDKVELGARV